MDQHSTRPGIARLTAFGLIITLAACSGATDRRLGTPAPSTTVKLANGPIAQACNRSGRNAANRSLCGCIQGVANRHLSEADQRRSAGFYTDPQRAQDVRQSDNRSNEVFWDRYSDYVDAAQQSCSAFR